MTREVPPKTIALAVLAVVVLIGGACYLLWRRGEATSDAPSPGLTRSVPTDASRGVAIQARRDLPPGIPHLVVPGPRRPGR